ncbi:MULTISPECIES: BLUF domain-containing protein [unclassified Psychrobacter]|uniref:BLUF domain-containing protein n=1 Tax=unclassified Psychrobacter TaxID=196806 RepID=UPI0025CFC282|nr:MULTISPECIES: BLUF domain-containing protein [unclassified Psychrobacter]
MYRAIDYALEVNKRDGEHVLMSLTYICKNASEDNGILLARTLEYWRRTNAKIAITSALVINDSYFVQNIEGSRPVINKVLEILINQYTNFSLHVVDVEEIEDRRWNGFLIKYLTPSVQDEEYIKKNFSSGSEFNPYLMTKNQITGLIQDIFEVQESSESENDNISE